MGEPLEFVNHPAQLNQNAHISTWSPEHMYAHMNIHTHHFKEGAIFGDTTCFTEEAEEPEKMFFKFNWKDHWFEWLGSGHGLASGDTTPLSTVTPTVLTQKLSNSKKA